MARLIKIASRPGTKLRRETMMKWTRLASFALAMGLAESPVMAQDTPKKKEPPKAAVSPTQTVLEQRNDIGRKLVAMAEDFTEDKDEVKPNQRQSRFRG